MVTVVGKDLTKVKRITCGSCASILEYFSSEVLSHTSTDYGGGRDTHYYINCPSCGKKAYVRNY